MKNVYFDNGATSFPKAPGVGEAILNYVNNVGGSVNRGVSDNSINTEYIVYETRELIGKLFGYDKPENVIFTKNITESLNLLLKSFLKTGDHVLVSSVEHNALMRPLENLKKIGVSYTKVPCDLDGRLDLNFLEENVNEKTKLIVMTHGSNVSGTILPLKKVGEIAKKNNIRFVIDSAQTAGHIKVDMEELNADAIAFTGHKGLLGPQGIGGAIIKSEMVKEMGTFIEGGTGSKSDTEIQPDYMPDKYESGTPNILGIIGLNVSLKYLFTSGVERIGEKEKEIREYFIGRLNEIENIRFIGSKIPESRLGVVSLDFIKADNAIVSNELARTYGISNRCGMHCAPSAHKSFNTFPQGTVRLSISHFSSKEEVDYTIDAIKKIMKEYNE